mmetsp:Transcript_14041/g.38162  ORF Transcript_14041/g.38162 Transcript_14041/m.38162 type:complete len:253 (-) Transcript_14041:123-881(-)
MSASNTSNSSPNFAQPANSTAALALAGSAKQTKGDVPLPATATAGAPGLAAGAARRPAFAAFGTILLALSNARERKPGGAVGSPKINKDLTDASPDNACNSESTLSVERQKLRTLPDKLSATPKAKRCPPETIATSGVFPPSWAETCSVRTPSASACFRGTNSKPKPDPATGPVDPTNSLAAPAGSPCSDSATLHDARHDVTALRCHRALLRTCADLWRLRRPTAMLLRPIMPSKTEALVKPEFCSRLAPAP